MRTIKVFNIAPCLFLVLVLSFLVVSCTDEKIIEKPKTGNGVMGLHNFNVSPGIVKGYVPQIMFFKQNEDGSFNCTFSGFTNWNSFETDWVNEYVLASFDQNGVVQTMTNMQYPSFDGSVANFGQGCAEQFYYSEGQNCGNFYTSRLSIDDNSVAFFNGSYDYSLGDFINKIFVVDVLNSNVKGISTVNTNYNFTNGLFRTADGELLWAHSDLYFGNSTLTYSLYSNTNELIFEESILSNDLQYVYTSYLTKKNEDYFFYALGDYWTGQAFDYDPDFLDPLQFFYPEPIPFEFEIRFGPGQSQKAHRFLVP